MVMTSQRSSTGAKRSKHRADIRDRLARHGGCACLVAELMWGLVYPLLAMALVLVAVLAVKHTDK
jgi:hypothetical protein